jgi:N-dimethylarginine dimethylaminohydrolase
MRKHLRLIEIPYDDAKKFACNSVVLGNEIIVPAGADKTYELLAKEGYNSHPVELSEFMKAGGAAKCLTMKISRK